ncbi:MAG TPA: hypothetical protein PKH65_01860 [Bacteroidia bacterium]|nr:hypothetical protein [Bacteroidia bacterium]
MKRLISSSLVLSIILAGNVLAKEKPGSISPKNNSLPGVAVADCDPGKAQSDLKVNNVRARILTGGDMFWDLSNQVYEVPIGSGKHSMYAAALWIGGQDAGGQIKVAAQTYRQDGNDMWPGPVDLGTISTEKALCSAYDKHFAMTRTEVLDFINNGVASNNIKNWPGNRPDDPNIPFAPYFDSNGDGIYDYSQGDYPYYNFSGEYPLDTCNVPVDQKTPVCNDYLFGDQSLWWVFNDLGNIHTSSDSQSQIGLEIQAQGFAFKTNDEINNMTFYKYKIINASSFSLNNTYFGQWVDPDLGNYNDDFVGCDVGLGLGFVYNGDADDDGAAGYGLTPPAAGFDFFQGPIADPNDGKDNDKDGTIDECEEQIIMSKFVYYDNVNGIPNGNPDGVNHFYNYLQGIWGDGLQMTYGEDGRNQANPPCDYMFPGTSDPAFPGQPWTEVTAGNTPADRRFLQSAGPFTLQPGAVNYITVGVVWARASSGGPEASIGLIKAADQKAQKLFDACFKLADGPNAPDMAIRELNRELIFSLVDYDTSTVERYDEVKVSDIVAGYPDSLFRFRFQGYQLYQLNDATVTTSELKDPSRARLIAQADVQDSITKIVNYYFDDLAQAYVPVVEVVGANEGLKHTFRITNDEFATGNTRLINNKTYYFTIVSYAHNYYTVEDPSDSTKTKFQLAPYFQGRNNVKVYSAIPHLPQVENNGQILGSQYGSSVPVQRLEGTGNGGNALELTAASLASMWTNTENRIYQPSYEIGKGPLNVQVYDPVLVRSYGFETKFDGVSGGSNWSMKNLNTNLTYGSERTLGEVNEQVLPEWGLTARISQVNEAGESGAINNGFIEASIVYGDAADRWLSAIADTDDDTPTDWIRSGDQLGDELGDIDEVYEGVLGGTWAPYRLCAKSGDGSPKWNNAGTNALSSLNAISSVDIVFTPDKSKWSRCVVLDSKETSNKLNILKNPSLNKNGDTIVGADNNDYPLGMSWFPGYAVNVETGERLNIAFAENPDLVDDNGNDMKWNPSSRATDASGNDVMGGMHFIYVFNHLRDSLNSQGVSIDVPKYDACKYIYEQLSPTSNVIGKRSVFKDAIWVNVPVMASGKTLANGNTPTSEIRVRLRVAKRYDNFPSTTYVRPDNNALTIGNTYYVATRTVKHNNVTYGVGQSFVATSAALGGSGVVTEAAPSNGFNPHYVFNTSSLANTINNTSTATTALDEIRVVPNPYYAYSSYEVNQLDNRVRITNLPSNCTVSIYTSNGVLIRQFKRAVASDLSLGGSVADNTSTSIDWDLNNRNGIKIASGMYIIHVSAPGIGEKTVKWFGVIRPIDLDSY